MADESTLQAVKEAADIVEIVGETVSLKRAGANYKGLCPFHSEKTPSFTVSPARGSYHCFGCGVGGDAIDFVMRSQGLSFPDALKLLARRYHIPLPERDMSAREQAAAALRERLHAINAEAAAVYHDFLLNAPEAAPARRYLRRREISPEIIEEFQIGYAPRRWDFIIKALGGHPVEDLEAAGLVKANDRGGYYDRFRNRVVFPILSPGGRHIGFGGRALDDQPAKYLNSPETPVFKKHRTLFGLYQNKRAIREAGRCLVVEGNFDLLALAARGVREVVAPLGTALTGDHVRAMKGYAGEAVMMFDGDAAGVKAAMRAVPLFLARKLPAKVAVLPGGHDPDSFVRERGPEALARAVAEARELPEFVFDRLVDEHGLTLDGKRKIIEDLKPVIAAIGDRDMQRTLFVSHFSAQLGLSPEQLLAGLPSPREPRSGARTEQAPPPEERRGTLSLSRAEAQILRFLIVYPEYIGSFLEAGLTAVARSDSARIITGYLEKIGRDSQGAGPERILDTLDGPERSFVTQAIIDAPVIDSPEDEAREKIGWLRDTVFRLEMRRLTSEINEAQRAQDSGRLLALLAEKREKQAKYEKTQEITGKFCIN